MKSSSMQLCLKGKVAVKEGFLGERHLSWDLKGELRLSGPCLKGEVRSLQDRVCKGAEEASGEWKGVQ